MVEYKKRATDTYRMTVKMLNGEVAPEDRFYVKLLRESIAFVNNIEGTDIKQYVKLQGRGYRRGVRSYNQGLPLKYATSADVYVYERR